MHSDNWAQKAKKLGYRSRAFFKLEEILNKTVDQKKIKYILELGASPGGWSQLVSKRFHNSRIYAIDILEMEPLENVNFFQENIENIDSIENIYDLKGKFNLVISDIAPNITGINTVDTENIYNLNKLTVSIAFNYLIKDGVLIMKTFQNDMLRSLRKKMELSFKIVQTYKPVASKKKSGEIYLYGVK